MSVQEKIHKLLWDRRYVCVPEECRPPGIDYIVIRDLTIDDRNIYSFVRQRELELARKQGVPTEVEILAEAKKSGYWTEKDDLILSKTDEHIAMLEAEKKKQKFLARKKSIQLDIDKAIRQKTDTLAKKNDYYFNSADYYASEVAACTLIRRVVLTVEGSPLWPNEQSFLLFKQKHFAFIVFVTNEVLSEGILATDEIREMARYPEWRLTWTLQRENLHTIFNRNVCNLTINQKLLIYWSRVYDSAFESTEPPSLEIINDDDKFDEWLANRDMSNQESSESNRVGARDHQERMQILDGEYSEVCNCGAKAKNVGKGHGERTMHATTCSWGTFRRYTREEREQIARQTYSRNTDRVRTLLEQEQQTVVDKGQIEEHHLRGKKTRHILGMKTDTVSINKP